MLKKLFKKRNEKTDATEKEEQDADEATKKLCRIAVCVLQGESTPKEEKKQEKLLRKAERLTSFITPYTLQPGQEEQWNQLIRKRAETWKDMSETEKLQALLPNVKYHSKIKRRLKQQIKESKEKPNNKTMEEYLNKIMKGYIPQEGIQDNAEVNSRKEKVNLEKDLTKLAVAGDHKLSRIQNTMTPLQEFKRDIKVPLELIRADVTLSNDYSEKPEEVVRCKQIKEDIKLKLIEAEKREELQETKFASKPGSKKEEKELPIKVIGVSNTPDANTIEKLNHEVSTLQKQEIIKGENKTNNYEWLLTSNNEATTVKIDKQNKSDIASTHDSEFKIKESDEKGRNLTTLKHKRPRKRSTRRCHLCRKRGHIKKECPFGPMLQDWP